MLVRDDTFTTSPHLLPPPLLPLLCFRLYAFTTEYYTAIYEEHPPP